jgi:hypothetical protein
MYQSRYANQITVTNTVPQHAAVSAMTGTEAAMVAVDFLSRIGLPHPIRKHLVRGHAFARIRPTRRCIIPRRTAQLGSLSEAAKNAPAPVRISYSGLWVLIVAGVALMFIEARYL